VGATFHTLRATYATRLLEEEVDIRTIQILMRHKSLDTTMRYLEVTDARKREAAQRLDRGL
jgi:integrase